MFKIFVSYAQEQLDWAEHLKEILRSEQVEVFVAEHDLAPGGMLSAEIAKKIKGTDLFLLLWTQAAKESQYVAKEIFLAKAEGKHIIPVLLQQGVALPAELGDVKYLDVAKDPEGQVKWLRDEVARRGRSKAVGNLVGFGILAFLGYVVLQSE